MRDQTLEESSRTALQIHTDALVADLHSDVPMRMAQGVDIGRRDTKGHMDIPRLRDGGIDLQVFACWIPPGMTPSGSRDKAERMIDAIDAQVAANRDGIAVCRTAKEADRIIGEGRIAVFIGIENGEAIANSLENLQHFYNRGVRYMTLTHTESTDWCISSADTSPAFPGLTGFGRDVVRAMNALGMIVDVSHISVSAFEEVLNTTTDPVIASHSCVHALCDHNRNLTDDQIKAIAANGGMIGINFFPVFLSRDFKKLAYARIAEHQAEIDVLKHRYENDAEARENAFYDIYGSILRQLPMAGVNVRTVVDHIDYVVRLVGPEYVGLGSDFDGISVTPEGLGDCSMLPSITSELVRRDYTEEDIKKILGGNFMRVFRQVCDR
jgi:membrane dipeptidase